MIIKGESKHQGHWKLTIIENLHSGKDNVIRAAELRIAKNYLERPIQLLCLMELQCNTVRNTETKLNPNVEEFRPSRPRRTTTTVAKVKIRDIQQENDDI